MQRGFIRLSWGEGQDEQTHRYYVVCVPVESNMQSAVKEATETLLSGLAHDRLDSLTAQSAGTRRLHPS